MLKLKGFLEKKEGEIVGVASTEAADRHGEIIKQDGWDLKLYKKNPVVLLSHNYQDFPIGRATNIKVEDRKLMFKAVFSESTEKARQTVQLIKEGILNAFSVGFIPKEWDKKKQNVITKAELMEISVVAVPANPQAVVVAKGMKGDLIENWVQHWLIDYQKQIRGIDKKAVTEVRKDKQSEKIAAGRSPEFDLKVLQKATGYMQELCRQAKEGGAEK